MAYHGRRLHGWLLSLWTCSKSAVKPKLLSDNGPSYIAGELSESIEAQGMSHVCGAPLHPPDPGKIERWHQTLKNRILLQRITRGIDMPSGMHKVRGCQCPPMAAI